MAESAPRFTITNEIADGLTAIESARGFLEAATLSEEWLRQTCDITCDKLQGTATGYDRKL
jgi:hypothetical protein